MTLTQIPKFVKSRFLFFWISSFVLASALYYALWLIVPNHRVFGTLYRMFLYHFAFPLQYIVIPCFFYGIFATLLTKSFRKATTVKRIWLTIAICLLTIIVSSPFGGMLWNFHDMQAGFFPENWVSVMIQKGFSWGMEIGWFIILLSIPYNIICGIGCYYLTKKGVKLYDPN
ncbi:hypothetical protein [Kordia jejudonensis]|uniref:hypothetical protein n=1 Tax=Kordia jejudonensis TaxID=1348245 RepID=UPI00062963B3|nr:hypothetical protein [Kordia jejudonensis]